MRVGDEGDLVGYDLAHQVDEGPDGIALDVELSGDVGADKPDVRIADVPLVRTGMYGDALCTESLAVPGGFLHVREIAPAGVPEGGYLVYVYTQSGHVPII